MLVFLFCSTFVRVRSRTGSRVLRNQKAFVVLSWQCKTGRGKFRDLDAWLSLRSLQIMENAV